MYINTVVTKKPEIENQKFKSAVEVCGVQDIVDFGDQSAKAEWS